MLQMLGSHPPKTGEGGAAALSVSREKPVLFLYFVPSK